MIGYAQVTHLRAPPEPGGCRHAHVARSLALGPGDCAGPGGHRRDNFAISVDNQKDNIAAKGYAHVYPLPDAEDDLSVTAVSKDRHRSASQDRPPPSNHWHD
jgi:hypothetical protein